MGVELFTSGGQINGYGVEMTMAAEDSEIARDGGDAGKRNDHGL